MIKIEKIFMKNPKQPKYPQPKWSKLRKYSWKILNDPNTPKMSKITKLLMKNHLNDQNIPET